MLSININKLRNDVELREQKKIKIFDKILELCYQRILNSNQKNVDCTCSYIVPTVVFGLPLYNVNDCVKFIINKLIDKGFNIVFAYPTTIHISWLPNNNQSRNNNQLLISDKNIQHGKNKKYINLENNTQNNTQNYTQNNVKDKDKYKKINDYKQKEKNIYNENDINLFQSKLDALFD